MTSIDGLITGLDTTSIINQLLAAERIPQNQLLAKQALAEARADVFADLRGRYDAVKSAAQALDLPDDWAALTASSSSDQVAVAATSGSITGTISFVVQQRAAAHAVYSTDTLTSLDDVVAAGGSVFSAGSFEGLGFSALVGDSLAEGVQTFEVTGESNAAVTVGDTAVPETLTISAANDEIQLAVNGVQRTLDVADGTYETREDLISAVNAAISAEPDFVGKVKARLNQVNQIEFITIREGSEATIQVTGGDLNGDIGLTDDLVALTGTDGVVSVNGVETIITNTDADTEVVLDAGTGTITATVSGPLRSGTGEVEQISFGTGSLSEVVTAVNRAKGLGTKAAIVKVDEGEYRLQLTATETGDDSAIDLDLGMFTGLGSGFTTLTSGQDAVLQIQGVVPYTVRSSADTFTDLLPGVDVTLQGTPAETITIDVTRNAEGLAERVGKLVSAINNVLKGLAESSAYDSETEKAALLTGDSTVRRARDDLTRALISPVAGATLSTLGLAGVKIQNDGTFTFEKQEFLDAYDADPAAVERLFSVDFDSEQDSAIGRILAEVDDAVGFGTGYLRGAEDSEKARVEDLGQQAAKWDVRLELRERLLRMTYSRLETSLAQLQSQSTWLTGQINSLSTPSAG
ncbi:MAG: flagellar filament capping protein FliD [Acidimicrobiales bacterium]